MAFKTEKAEGEASESPRRTALGWFLTALYVLASLGYMALSFAWIRRLFP